MFRIVRANRAFNQALDLFRAGDLAAAARLFGEIAGEFSALGVIDGAIQASYMRGVCLEQQNDHEGAVAAYQAAAQVARQAGDARAEAMSLNGLGSAYLLVDRARARSCLEAARREAETLSPPDPGLLSTILGNLAKVAQLDGDWRAAAAGHERSALLARTAGDTAGEVDSLSDAALCLAQGLRFRTALERATQAVTAARSLGEPRVVAVALGNHARVAQLAGEYATAVAASAEAVAQARRAGPAVLSRALAIAADAATCVPDRYDDAIRYARECLAVTAAPFTRVRGAAQLSLAKALARKGDPAGAIVELDSAVAAAEAASDRAFLSVLLAARAQCLLAGDDLDQARRAVEESLRLWSETIPVDPAEPTAYVGALERYAGGFLLLEEIELRARRPRAAFAAHEAGRARLLAARLTHRLGVDDEQMSVEHAKRLADRLGAVLLVLSARYENDAVVGFTAYVFRPDGRFEVRHLDDTGDPSAEAAAALRRLRVEEPTSQDLRADLLSELVTGALHDELSAILVAPIADLLPSDGRTPVVLTVDHFLHHVPFAALHGPDQRALVERFPLCMVPSLRVLRLLEERRRRRPPTDGCLVVGSADLGAAGSGGNHHLREVREVARLWGTEPLTGHAATSEAVLARLPGSGTVHVAAHATLGPSYEFGLVPGALHLGAGEAAQDTVTSEQIERLNLDSELVVISACVTSLGQIATEGVLGLARAFLSAGASTVIGSLWRVKTWSAANLMIELNRHLRSGLPPAQALRRAMLTTRQRYGDPVHWAPFTAVGLP